MYFEQVYPIYYIHLTPIPLPPFKSILVGFIMLSSYIYMYIYTHIYIYTYVHIYVSYILYA
jgi:hypothetical protein